MTLTLTPDLERRLTQEAERQGVKPDEYALQLLDKQLEPEDRKTALADALRSFREGDAEEQRETFEALKQGLNENHTSDRVIYP